MLSKIILIAVAVCGLSCVHFGDEPQGFYAQELQSCPAYATVSENEKASVTVSFKGKTYTYTDEEIIPSDFTVAEHIETFKINAPLAEKIDLVDLCLQKGADYKTALSVCFPLLPRFVDGIAQGVSVAPVDAKVVYKNGKFGVMREKNGVALDERKLYAGIYYTFKFSGAGRTVKADTVSVPPTVTARELAANLTLRGEYTTDYTTSAAGRAHNVTLALSKLDGLSISAGEQLSFNAVVGARTEANGFESAKIIVDGKYTDGVGGGVCQASTAVYNAALVAGLSATANAHSICPSYCPPGLDAMISSASDLVIENNTAHDVYISVSAADGKATVRIFGEPSKYKVVPESVVKRTVMCELTETLDDEHKYFDDTAVSGDRMLISPGKDGVESETYLNYYDENGMLVERKFIRKNTYKPTPRVIMIAP